MQTAVKIISSQKVDCEDKKSHIDTIIIYEDDRFAIFNGSQVFTLQPIDDLPVGEFWYIVSEQHEILGLGGKWPEQPVFEFVGSGFSRSSLIREVAAAKLLYMVL